MRPISRGRPRQLPGLFSAILVISTIGLCAFAAFEAEARGAAAGATASMAG